MTLTPQFARATLAIGRHAGVSPAELKGFQDGQLRRLVCHAYESVPFYRKLFDRHRLHPRHIRGTVDLDLIPTVSKEDLRAQPVTNVVAKGLDPDRLIAARTSGSSGEPLVIRRTWSEQSLQYLLRLRALGLLGVRIGDQMATVELVRAEDAADPKLFGRALRMARVKQTLRIDGLLEPAAIVEQLRCWRPDVVTGMPGMLCRVAEYLLAHGCKGLAPRLVIVAGEVLTPVMRRSLRDGFGAPVREIYASLEFPMLGWDCGEEGQLHGCDDGAIVELLHEGQPVAAGERGEVVATNLHSYAMPLIRYRLGDIATRGDQSCACGRPFTRIHSIEGRPAEDSVSRLPSSVAA